MRIFFNVLSWFTPYWDCKPTNAFHADSPGVYTSDKFLNLSTKDKIHLKTDCINGSIINGVQQPILCSLLSDKQPGYKVFREPETIQFTKINNFFNTIIFYLEDDNNEEVIFNGENVDFHIAIDHNLNY